ncbi:hypothetical protein BJF86_13630 [Serinicoccus sp. CNJ-927]|uniref:DUF2516 family protein n=1 Tax=Serinicoccus TaxID=265976 RepID=UPI0003B4754F|nr:MULTISPECIES: DUF2516 family protein [Serinicoccus]OLT43828.1 hypothetical protein BJF86_13630 [Serinicoccus sp. CNJ-927]
MGVIYEAQNMVELVLSLGLFAMMVWALVDCLRTRQDAFVAAGKRTKTFWSLITGGATLLGFISIGSALSIFNVIAVVAAAVYLADVRPAVKSVQGRGGSNTHMGPYGPW